MIGLKRGTVKLTAHHKQWHKLFEVEKKLLLTMLANDNVVIEHVGSTAVEGVVAKPIIDMGWIKGVRYLLFANVIISLICIVRKKVIVRPV
ncbi:MAG: GrpB family protein [Candidatus Pacebacteria bacterium]|nr:GrpB family protein [Candidatus Paceibacterota bacterium]